MPIEILNAISHVAGSVSTPNNANGVVNNTWTSDTDNISWTSRWRLGLPPEGTVDVAQSLLIRARKQTGSGTPSMLVTLFVNDVDQGWLGTYEITSLTGEDIELPFDLLARDGKNVSIQIEAVSTGGNPASRATVQIDAFVWTCSYAAFEGSGFKGWDGGAWVDGLLKKWDGGAWVPARVMRWSGSDWVEVP